MSDVFISHAEADSDIALEIALGLEEAGYGTWCYEIDSIPGASYLIQTGQAVEQSKAVLLGEIVKRMENPFKYVRNVPAGEREQLKQQLDRLYAGYKNLMLGHSLIAINEFSGADVEKFIRQYYEKAKEYLPESTYLQKYLFH